MTPEERYLRTQFLDRLAHDIRGATGTSLGALDEVERTLEDGAEHAMFLAILRRGLRKLLRIGESLAEAGEIERGPVQVVFALTDVGEIMKDAIKRAETLENRKGISVRMLGGENVHARFDAPRMSRAICEVLLNAIRHATDVVTLDATVVDDSLMISIQDDGNGFKLANPDSIVRFAPSEERRGLGLGLPMATDVALMHGGTLSIARENNRTVVRITIPARQSGES